MSVCGLDIGLTSATLAEQASDEDKINRSRDSARKAYESARNFMDRISLSKREYAALHKMLGQLEDRLHSLEEIA